MANIKKCPQCDGPLVEVRQSADSMLNEYQWASSIAGNWYCESCQSNDRGNQPLCYWWTSELKDAEKKAANTAELNKLLSSPCPVDPRCERI